ncbi:MAG: hypothetical protein RLZZ127_585 [Planctomycetota bacterium]|jgi:5-methylcytosine-specific restriction endonuclease McrA
MHRCLVLDTTGDPLAVIPRWIDALGLVITGKVTALAHYERIVRSQHLSFRLPAVAMVKSYVGAARRRPLFDAPVKAVVLARDGFACQYCGRPVSLTTGTKDHVQPRSRGGADRLDNVVAACIGCNRRKADRTPAECGMHPARRPRSLTQAERIGCLMSTLRAEERRAWAEGLAALGIHLAPAA